jgi:hypothetical protein
MAPAAGRGHPEQVHTGPTSQAARCCRLPLQTVALTSHADAQRHVELVRCSACGTSTWRVDGALVDKAGALGALSAVFARATPRPAPRRVRAPLPRQVPAAVAPEHELADLLAGWQVHGS